MTALVEWEQFAAEMAAIACVDPDEIRPDDPVVEGALLDSLALTELCALVFSHAGVDLLDDHGVYRFPGLTWQGLREVVNPDTAFVSREALS